MIFPQADRVKYDKNPLAEVVLQLSFINRLGESDGFGDDLLLRFHQLIAKDFPYFVPEDQKTISLELDTESFTQNNSTIYQFISIDRKSKVLVSSDWIAFSTSAYFAWEKFRDEFLKIFQDFNSLGEKHVLFSRAGLRYRDVIERRKLNPELANSNWTELLSPAVAPYSIFGELKNIGSYQANLILELEKKGRLVANLGLITNTKTLEQVFLIDGDFFTEGTMDYETVISSIDYFNVEARNFFRWCITEKLHRALQPVSYADTKSE